jgi:hypothetical protein
MRKLPILWKGIRTVVKAVGEVWTKGEEGKKEMTSTEENWCCVRVRGEDVGNCSVAPRMRCSVDRMIVRVLWSMCVRFVYGIMAYISAS